MKNKNNEIDLMELKRAADAIFFHLIDELKIKNISIPKDSDFYWEVPGEHLFSVRKNQPQLDIGRLSDDWEFLSAALDDNRQAVGYMLTHLAPILRYIGESEKK